MERPKVSIVVPIYKTEKYLNRCLQSLKEQTLKEIEIILVDDDSPDRCPEICDKAAAEDTRIKVIHKTNEGAGMAKNSGIESATGEYIGFIDSDDYVDYKMYEALYDAAVKYNADLVVSGMCFVGGNIFGKDGEYIEKNYFSKHTLFDNDVDIKNLMLGIFGALPHEPDDSRYGMSVCKNLFKREIVEKNRLRFLSEREILSEDTLFMVDYVRYIDKAVGIPEAFYYYCRNEESVSKSYDSGRLDKSIAFIKELESRIAVCIPPEEYKIYLHRLVQAFGRVCCSQEIMYATENKISYFALRKRLKEICTKEEIVNPLKTYPWYKLPFKQAVFAFLLKHKLYMLQKIVVAMRAK